MESETYTEKSCELRDLSKRRHYLFYGSNNVAYRDKNNFEGPRPGVVFVKEALVPDYPGYKVGCKHGAKNEHDFAILVLKKAVAFSDKIRPICLPLQNYDTLLYSAGRRAVAAGWGMQHTDNKIDAHTKLQSKLLKRVNLQITGSTDDHPKMFGTKVEFKRGEYQDPCAGDGGGPLMDRLDTGGEEKYNRWVLIGTLQGGGYDCRNGELLQDKEGIWNKVSYWTDWIKDQIKGKGKVTGRGPEEHKVINWQYNMKAAYDNTACAEIGQQVTFQWDPPVRDQKGHNVVEVKTKEDFDDCTGYEVSEEGSKEGGVFNWLADKNGTYYFVCGVQDHCKAGPQKLAITVPCP